MGKNPVLPGSNTYRYTEPPNNRNQIAMTVERRYMERVCRSSKHEHKEAEPVLTAYGLQAVGAGGIF